MAQAIEAVETDGGPPPASAQAAMLPVVRQLRELGPVRIVALGLVFLAFAGFFTYLVVRAVEPRMTVLFSGLELEDSREIVAQLDQMNTDYTLSPDGSAIMVSADEVLRLRMALAEEGLPGGGSVGYEIFDNADAFGTTAFLSNVNLTRALEGELARTIASMRHVRAARVHLVQPRRELFQRQKTEPSASVFLTVRRAGSLGRSEIAAIQHLVASAVPGLQTRQVTVLDDAGNLLARSGGEEDVGLFLGETETFRASVEERLKTKIVQLLERTLGTGRVDAEVAVEMDFDEVSTTQEIFDPESQVARSTQSVEEERDIDERDPADNVSVANNLPTERNQGTEGATSRETNNRTEETVNFEISRTIRNETRKGGKVERVSIAVQVDGTYRPDADGNLVFQPRSDAELAQIEDLVRSAAGLDEERGDTISIVSREFITPDIEPIEEPGLFDFTKQDLMSLAETGGLILTALLVLVFGLRPLIRRLLPDPQPHSVNGTSLTTDENGRALLVHSATGTAISIDESGNPQVVNEAKDQATSEEDDEELKQIEETRVKLNQIDGQVRLSLINDVARIIEERPDDAVRVIRSWMHSPT